MTHVEAPLTAPQAGQETPGRSSTTIPRGTLWGLGLFIATLWMLIRPNRGVAHDGMIYALYAMARLYPQSLGSDFFVRYGTQDHFTVFSPLYAVAIRLLGLDHATALLIFINQVAFFAAAWWLIRRFTSVDKALVGIGLLIVLPSWYGADRLFSHTEMFLTPRQSAEALVLLGIGFILSSRRIAAAAALLAAVLLHPIIAAAGILFWILWEFGVSHPKQALAVFCSGIALCAAVALVPHGPLQRFDPLWLTTLQHRLTYLFPTRWTLGDWHWSIPGLATQLVGALRARSEQLRKLCIATLAAVIAGLILAIVGSDLLQVIVAAQLQMWRWLWLSGVLSVLLLIPILGDTWKSGPLGRAAALLLIVEWLASTPLLVLVTAPLAGLCAFGVNRNLRPGAQKAALIGAGCLLATVFIYVGNDLRLLIHQVLATPPADFHLTRRITQLRLLAGSAPLSTAVMLAVWHLGRSTSPRVGRLLAVLGLATCAVVLPLWLLTWTRVEYSKNDVSRFAAWRNVIPPAAEVIWPDTPPLSDWYSLHRASYWSSLQMAGMVFSRQDFDIGVRREKAATPWVPYLGGLNRGFIAQDLTKYSPAEILANLCAIPDVHFLASWRNLGPTPYPTVIQINPVINQPTPLYLYRCNHGPH